MFLCYGASVEPSDASFLRDVAAAPAFIGDGTTSAVALLRVIYDSATDAITFLGIGGGAALVILRVLPVAMLEHDDEN